ncbi:TlpA family protein disulfide reductase [Mangrovibacterium diazotrophicum]|uniref:Thiol-disulfide isomerase/thioredoxin n=1 Tax=Mangrovibacterium diazotrophicum TaxID=1261403 RepID=A0A419VZ61_9BACT|nr:TlpA disulfide reductase family protein [Mangrovibacterium diazotrophicum]RKD88518.1 thiol-disulfide isomerase/thioredoxin [Mangrovibacterium diazotrophicum]
MKRITLFLLALVSPFLLVAQKKIENPEFGFKNDPNLELKSIELTDSATVLSFQYKAKEGRWIRVPKESYIKLPDSSELLYATKTDGIPFGERYTLGESGEVSYHVYFPLLPSGTVEIDFGEAISKSSWEIFAIQLNESKSPLPDGIEGHWFDSRTGLYAASITRKQVVYRERVWQIESIKEKGKSIELNLKSGEETAQLYVACEDKGLAFGTNKKALQHVVGRFNRMAVARNGNVDLEVPKFSLDSAEYCGYILGFNPRYSPDRFTVSYDQLTNWREQKLEVKVDSTGYFQCKIPVLYPHTVVVRNSGVSSYPYLEPGKKLFQVFDLSNSKQDRLFMGESAAISSEIIQPFRISELNRTAIMDSVHGGTFAQYKVVCQQISERDFQNLNKLYADGKLSKRAWQLHQMDAQYDFLYTLLSYSMAWGYYYKEKRGASFGETMQDYTMNVRDTMPMDFTDVITNEIANNPYAPSSYYYDRFLNGFSNLKVRAARSVKVTVPIAELVDTLRARGQELTEEDEQAIACMKQMESITEDSVYSSFRGQYQDQFVTFNTKYRKEYGELRKVYAPESPSYKQVEAYLVEQGVVLTPEEQELVNAAKQWEETEEVQEYARLVSENREALKDFHSKFGDIRTALYRQKSEQAQLSYMETNYGIEPGLLTELMAVRAVSSKIYRDMSPLKKEELAAAKTQVQSEDYKNYLDVMNAAIEEQLASLEALPVGNIRSAPEVENEKLFAEILKRYEGKVVFVDFWATWCGPCTSGIQQMRPLKAEMKDTDVVFLYITGESSPALTWRPKTADIPGEHFRLSREQWSAVCNQFNVSGIPRYMLVDRQGELVNDNVGHMTNAGLKLLLEKYLNEEETSQK